jgi:molybdopterin/thiamine biosynthesis adenylyltransferase
MVTRLSDNELERFKRQLTPAGHAEDHRIETKNSTALIAGVGGVGGTAALHLAIAGISRLKLVHAGVLTPSNPNRQILMTDDIGQRRLSSNLCQSTSSPWYLFCSADKKRTEADASVHDGDILMMIAPVSGG